MFNATKAADSVDYFSYPDRATQAANRAHNEMASPLDEHAFDAVRRQDNEGPPGSGRADENMAAPDQDQAMQERISDDDNERPQEAESEGDGAKDGGHENKQENTEETLEEMTAGSPDQEQAHTCQRCGSAFFSKNALFDHLRAIHWTPRRSRRGSWS